MNGVATVLLTQGVLGVVTLVLGMVVIRQYNDNKALQAKYDTLQDARLTDAKDAVDKVTQPLASISQTLGLVYDKLRASKEL